MTAPHISFSGFRFNPATGELTGAAGATRLGPQPSKVLAMLVERRGELVTRAELKDALWGDTVVEADMGLNTCIRQIRAALGDEAEQGRFIETFPRRGYRFVAAVDGDSNGSLSAQETPARNTQEAKTTSPAMSTARTPRSRSIVVWSAAAVLVAATITFAIYPRAKNQNVAILPTKLQTDDPAWARDLGARVTDQLVEKLTSHAPGIIGVVGPATTSALVNDPSTHPQLGKSLNVGFVLSSFVRPSDSTVFVQVIRVSDGVHVYAMRRRAWGVNIDSLTSEIADGAARKILDR